MRFTVVPKGNADQRRAYETKVSPNCEKKDCIRCSCPSVCSHGCHGAGEKAPAPFGTVSLMKQVEHLTELAKMAR